MGLTVSDLCFHRSGRPILRDLSFSVADGAPLLLRGPNGAGKSTLLRALAGLLPAGGRIEIDGVGLRQARDLYAERLAYAGHLDAIKPQLTVRENLAFWSRLYGGEGEADASAAFDLGAIADRPAHACSAGQKRRLGLARLLVAPRRLWLLDEPTVSLDAASIARFLAAVRAHCAAGGIAVIATHLDLALPGGRTLDLAPLAGRRDAPSLDPFLAGTWA